VLLDLVGGVALGPAQVIRQTVSFGVLRPIWSPRRAAGRAFSASPVGLGPDPRARTLSCPITSFPAGASFLSRSRSVTEDVSIC
jgi:hypothetical protein